MSKPKPKPKKERPLNKAEEKLYSEAIDLVSELVDDLKAELAKKRALPCREFSLAYTKLEEAEMWLMRGFDALGYHDEEEGDEEEEEEEPEKEAEEETEEAPS